MTSPDWRAAEAAAYLNRVRRSAADIERLKDEIEARRSALPPGSDYTRERVMSSPRHDALEQAVLEVMDMIEDYCTELASFVALQRDAHEAVAMLEDPRHRAVLTLYYVDGNPWSVVARKLGYDESWCRRLRSEALPLFWEVMPMGEKTVVPRAF